MPPPEVPDWARGSVTRTVNGPPIAWAPVVHVMVFELTTVTPVHGAGVPVGSIVTV